MSKPTRTERVTLRITLLERLRWERAAAEAGVVLSEFVRQRMESDLEPSA